MKEQLPPGFVTIQTLILTVCIAAIVHSIFEYVQIQLRYAQAAQARSTLIAEGLSHLTSASRGSSADLQQRELLTASQNILRSQFWKESPDSFLLFNLLRARSKNLPATLSWADVESRVIEKVRCPSDSSGLLSAQSCEASLMIRTSALVNGNITSSPDQQLRINGNTSPELFVAGDVRLAGGLAIQDTEDSTITLVAAGEMRIPSIRLQNSASVHLQLCSLQQRYDIGLAITNCRANVIHDAASDSSVQISFCGPRGGQCEMTFSGPLWKSEKILGFGVIAEDGL